jgi:hypothetical protein
VTGTPFFFQQGPDPDKHHFGVVKQMIHWADSFSATLLVDTECHVLESDGLQYWVEPVPNLRPTLIFWNQITHRCKMYDQPRDGMPMKAVVRVSTTKPAMDGIDFDGYM